MKSVNRRRRSILKSSRNSILNGVLDESSNSSGPLPTQDRKRVSFGQKHVKEFQPVTNAESPQSNFENRTGDKTVLSQTNMDVSFCHGFNTTYTTFSAFQNEENIDLNSRTTYGLGGEGKTLLYPTNMDISLCEDESPRNSIFNAVLHESSNSSGPLPTEVRKRVSFGQKQIKEFQTAVVNAESPHPNYENRMGDKTVLSQTNMDVTFCQGFNKTYTSSAFRNLESRDFNFRANTTGTYGLGSEGKTLLHPANMDISGLYDDESSRNSILNGVLDESSNSSEPLPTPDQERVSFGQKQITEFQTAVVNAESPHPNYENRTGDKTVLSQTNMDVTFCQGFNKTYTSSAFRNLESRDFNFRANTTGTYGLGSEGKTLLYPTNMDFSLCENEEESISTHDMVPIFKSSQAEKVQEPPTTLLMAIQSSPESINPPILKVQSNMFKKKQHKAHLGAVFSSLKTPRRKRNRIDERSENNTVGVISESSKPLVVEVERRIPKTLCNAICQTNELSLLEDYTTFTEADNLQTIPQKTDLICQFSKKVDQSSEMLENRESPILDNCDTELEETETGRFLSPTENSLNLSLELSNFDTRNPNFTTAEGPSDSICNSTVVISECLKPQRLTISNPIFQANELSLLAPHTTITENLQSMPKITDLSVQCSKRVEQSSEMLENQESPELYSDVSYQFSKNVEQSSEMLENQESPFLDNDCDTEHDDTGTETFLSLNKNSLNLSLELFNFVTRYSKFATEKRLIIIEKVLPEIIKMTPEVYAQFKTTYVHCFRPMYWQAVEVHRQLAFKFGPRRIALD